MARKTSKPAKGKPASKKKNLPARGRGGGAPASPARSGAAKPRRSSPTGRAPRPKPPIALSPNLSLDRKLDIAGTVLALLGLLTLLSLASANRSLVTGGWIAFLRQVFGAGTYVLPLAMILVGLWLVLRHFDRIPVVSFERIFGVVLLFANLLAWVHFARFPENRTASFGLASAGEGGGYLGAGILELLRAGFGIGGAAVALIAWLLIALAFTLDVTIAELFRWLPPLITRLQDSWDEFQAQRAARAANGNRPRYTPTATNSNPPDPVYTQPTGTGIPILAPEEFSAPRNWVLPSIADILDQGGEIDFDKEFDLQRAKVIEETLASFGAPAKVVEISRGPTITQFGVEPDFVEGRGGRMRVRVSKISSLADDLALALSARTIRIQAPVPGKGYIGIEVPNDETRLVAVRDVMESEAFRRLKSPLRFALGQDVAGNAVAADLTVMPHLLIAGATGSGKSVCVNSLITCLLLHNTPDDLRLIMVDPKRVELTGYNGIPHLLAPVVVELERVVGALQWVAREMDQRYHKLAQAGCRNIKDYNARLAAQNEKKLPQLVVIIDELADLMMLAPDETERTITRLAQLARATGIHLVLATQRPSVDVVTGLIKANFPARIAFAVASGVDSRVILDQPGAERLLGSGDMLFQAPDAAAPARLQGTFVSDNEIARLVDYWRALAGTVVTQPTAIGGIPGAPPPNVPLKQMPFWEEMAPEEEVDPIFAEAVDLARRQGRASISMLQRRLRIGYTRAARLIEVMEDKGIVGPPASGTGLREILDYGPAAPPADDE